MAEAEVLAAEDDAEAAVEPELLLGLAPADGSDEAFGAAAGAAGADVAGAMPLGEVEQHDLP